MLYVSHKYTDNMHLIRQLDFINVTSNAGQLIELDV